MTWAQNPRVHVIRSYDPNPILVRVFADDSEALEHLRSMAETVAAASSWETVNLNGLRVGKNAAEEIVRRAVGGQEFRQKKPRPVRTLSI